MYPQQMPVSSQLPPSRVGAIVTLVMGLIVMLVITPIVLTVSTGLSVFTNIYNPPSADNPNPIVSAPVEVGEPLTVQHRETVLIVSTPNAKVVPTECQLDASEKTITLEYQKTNGSATEAFVGNNVPAGEYTLRCNPAESAADFELRYVSTSELIGGAVKGLLVGFGISTIFGIAGLILTIVGIVWLVKINKRRKAFFNQFR